MQKERKLISDFFQLTVDTGTTDYCTYNFDAVFYIIERSEE